ncbi:DUF4232 domain-containing protein [Streptomyces sp. NPDC050264]|uniref:DUF4232 domain-containing protein n=1 Tax=Streptomyces sp. NPDC050264 TaxID=3155038 RepID=UPI00343D5145
MRSTTTARIARRRNVWIADATLTAVAGLSLTACSGSDTDAAGGAKTSTGTLSSTSSTSSASPSSTSSDGGSKVEGGSASGDTRAGNTKAGNAKAGSGDGTTAEAAVNGATKTGSKVSFCKTEGLAIDAVDAALDENEGRINIAMINRNTTTCSATGFAGVGLKDEDNTSNPIERGPVQPRITTLKPGDAAVFDLAYTVDNSGNSLASPPNILVTPPNETHTVTPYWPAGAGESRSASAHSASLQARWRPTP